MRNRLKSATGLALSPTLIFDYPNSAALAGYMHRELVGSPSKAPGGRARGSRNPAGGGDPFQSSACGRRECWNCCSRWQTKPRQGTAAPAVAAEKDIADMDLDALVNAAFMDDDE